MSNLIKQAEKCWAYGIGRMVLAAVCAHSVSISIGICQGYSAILLPQLASSKDFTINAEQSSWLASLGAVTNPIGSILSGLLAEYYGRKRSIQFSSFPFLLGWLCIAVAKDIDLLYAGRLITGIAAGMATASYTYVGEVSTPENRGIFQALGPVSASFGILLTYVLGYFFRWSTVAYVSIVFCIFTAISIQCMPESPAYLLKKDRRGDALLSFMWFRRSNAVAQSEYEACLEHTTNLKNGTKTKDLYLNPATVKPFFILVGLFLLQELSGIYTILFYAVNFFQDANLQIDEYVSSIIVGVIRLIMSIVAAVLINKFGRRILCMTSSAGMGVSMLLTIIYLKYYEINNHFIRVFPMFPLISILFNVFFSMIGMLPIPWILVGELFPLQVRSIMSGVVICMAQCFIFICVKVYPDMIRNLTFSGTLMVFVASSFLAFFYSKVFLPETKNKSLDEIEALFRKAKGKDLFGVDNKAFVIRPEAIDDMGGAKNKSVNLYTIHIPEETRHSIL